MDVTYVTISEIYHRLQDKVLVSNFVSFITKGEFAVDITLDQFQRNYKGRYGYLYREYVKFVVETLRNELDEKSFQLLENIYKDLSSVKNRQISYLIKKLKKYDKKSILDSIVKLREYGLIVIKDRRFTQRIDSKFKKAEFYWDDLLEFISKEIENYKGQLLKNDPSLSEKEIDELIDHRYSEKFKVYSSLVEKHAYEDTQEEIFKIGILKIPTNLRRFIFHTLQIEDRFGTNYFLNFNYDDFIDYLVISNLDKQFIGDFKTLIYKVEKESEFKEMMRNLTRFRVLLEALLEYFHSKFNPLFVPPKRNKMKKLIEELMNNSSTRSPICQTHLKLVQSYSQIISTIGNEASHSKPQIAFSYNVTTDMIQLLIGTMQYIEFILTEYKLI